MKKFLLIIIIALTGSIYSSMYAQTMTVSGVVTDNENQPLPGVSIVEQGTTNGVLTDLDGKYSIKVSGEKSVLTFSFIGFTTQELTVRDRTKLNVTMVDEAIDMKEVVVVGYGTQKKASVVGAISTADPADIQRTGTTNLTQALGGRIAGVISRTPGGRPGEDDAQIFIRGRASYNTGSYSPLVLVDGVEREYSQIDPEDIESMSVLKDASATAVFGVRGANGVILINTKRGEVGKPVVDARAVYSVNSPTRLPKRLGSYDFARLKNEALANVGQTPEFSAHDLDMYRTGASPYTHPDNDYIDDMLKNHTLKQQYNLTVRGGTDFVKYYVSANFLDEDGIYKTFDNNEYDTNVFFKRYGLRSNLDFNITRSTVFGVDVSGRLEERHNNGYGDNLFQSLVRTPPNYFNYVNPDGSLGGGLNLVNPYAALSRYGYEHSKKNVFEVALKLNQKLDFITKGLSVRAMFSYVSSMRSRRDLYERPTLWKFTKDERYEIIQDEEFIKINTSSGPQTRNYTYEAAINYDRKFGDHALTGTLAYNRIESYYESSVANLPTGYVNYVGRITYGYRGKYLAEVNAGYNGSVQFSKRKRYGLFPAFSAGWIVSEESFWNRNQKWVDYLKIRGAYGEVGNDNIGSSKFYYLQTYPLITSNRPGFGFSGSGQNYIYEGTLGNSIVGWERSAKLNMGIDMRLFDSKVSFTVDVFQEIRSNILDYDRSNSTIWGMGAADSGSQGFAPENIGKVQNRGLELDLGYNNKINDFEYYVKANFTFARNKIKKIGENPVTYPWMSKVGRPIGQRYGLICDGFYNTQEEIDALPSSFSHNLKLGDLKYRDINNDGRIDSYDMYPIGKTRTPEIMYGLTIGGTWKGFDLQLFFQGAAKTDIYMNGYGYWEFTNLGSIMKHHLGRWTPENRESATYPSLSPSSSEQNHRLSTFWLEDGAYLRLKNVQLAYNIPKSVLSKAKISGLKVYIGGTNLFTLSKVKEYDPEASDGEGTTYPQMKMITAGVNLSF